MPRTLVLHTTEGSTIAGAVATMKANRSWSNWVCDPATGGLMTLTDSERGDRSLRNLSGGVETNNRPGVWQLEIVGFAANVPIYDEDWYRTLGRIIVDICNSKAIPKVFPHPFTDDAGYGTNGAVRLTAAQWSACEGIVGHQHVPENLHWDPGRIDRVIPYVTGDSMAHDEDQIRRLQRFLRSQGKTTRLVPVDIGTTGPAGDGVDGQFGEKTASAAIVSILKLEDRIRALTDELTDEKAAGQDLEGRIHDLEQQIQNLEAGALPDDVVAMVVELDQLAGRLNDRIGPDQ